MKAFAKENSILGKVRRHGWRHVGLMWPPSSPFFTALSGKLPQRDVFCAFEEGRLLGSWGCTCFPFSVFAPTLCSSVLFMFTVFQVPELVRNCLLLLDLAYSVVTVSCTFPFRPHSTPSFKIHLRRYLQSPPWLSPVWVGRAGSVWPQSTWLLLC